MTPENEYLMNYQGKHHLEAVLPTGPYHRNARARIIMEMRTRACAQAVGRLESHWHEPMVGHHRALDGAIRVIPTGRHTRVTLHREPPTPLLEAFHG